MKQELAPRFNYEPATLDEAFKIADYIAKSDLAPNDYKGKPGNVLVAMQMGAEIGLKPLNAIQNIAVINGRPAIWGDAALAIVRASGLLESFKETYDDTKQEAFCVAKRKGEPNEIKASFSLSDAERIQVYDHGKQVPLASRQMYKNYPKRMCQMRARAFVLRDGFADILKGLGVREEVEDYGQEQRDVTPTPSMPERLSTQEQKTLPFVPPKADTPLPINGNTEKQQSAPTNNNIVKIHTQLQSVSLVGHKNKQTGEIGFYTIVLPNGLILTTTNGSFVSEMQIGKKDGGSAEISYEKKGKNNELVDVCVYYETHGEDQD